MICDHNKNICRERKDLLHSSCKHTGRDPVDRPGRIQKDRPDRHALQNKSLFHTIPVKKFSDLRSNHTAAKMRRDSKKRHRICPHRKELDNDPWCKHQTHPFLETINPCNNIIRNIFLLKRQSLLLLIMLSHIKGRNLSSQSPQEE